MTRIKLPYIHTFMDSRGKRRHTFRRTGCKKVTLPGLPGSREFMEAYQACLDGQPIRIDAGATRTKPGSFSALIAVYYGSSDFSTLKASTKTTYRGIIERFREKYGNLPVRDLQPQHLRTIMDKGAATPAATNNLLKILRQLLRFAVERGWRDDNPASNVRRIKNTTTGFHSWTEGEIATFEAKYPIGSRERLAMALLLYTGQRRSDVVRMGWQHVKDDFILVCQMKTDKRLELPIHASLREVLDGTAKDHLTFITTQTGAPYKKESFTNWFHDSCVAAGLAHCSPHGLRKAAARRLAEAGCTTHQIAAVTGHSSLKEIETYTSAANQKRLATSAMNSILKDER